MTVDSIRTRRGRSLCGWLGALVVLAGLAPSCATAPAASAPGAPQPAPPYDFARPVASHALPGRLTEISGLAVLDDRHVAAVEDQRGVVYVIDFTTGEVVEERTFEDDGDYEDVERARDHLFVLRSDGDLFEIEDWDEKKPDKVDRHRTDVPKDCDAEGLALEPSGRRLLVACKERAGKRLGGYRAVYAFDLEEDELEEDPAFVLSLDELGLFVPAEEDAAGDGLAFESGPDDFKPSAIRFHPLTGELYVLSSVTKAVAVLGPEGRLRAVYPLSGRLLPQPEGLAFLPDGDLLVASEGRGGDGTLHRFAYRPPAR